MFIICAGVPNASAAEWDSATFILSLENPTVSKGDYTLTVVEFDGYGKVAVNVSENGVYVGGAIIEQNESNWYYLEDDNIRMKGINVTDINVLPLFGSIYSPQAEITFGTKRSTEDSGYLDVDITTENDEYILDEIITVSMKIRNVGDVKINDLQLDIDPDGLVVMSNSLPSIINLEDGTYRSEEVKFRFPSPLTKGLYNISVQASWINADGTRSINGDSLEIEVKNPVEIQKITTSETMKGKNIYASISVENIQTRAVKARLIDVLPIFFSLAEGTVTENKSDLVWEFVLKPNEMKVFSYQMVPEQAGAHRAPEAHVTWNLWGEDYTNCSDSDNIIAVYKGVSYRDIDIEPPIFPEVVMVMAGEDLSKLVDAKGIALTDIKVINQTLDCFVFIPKGTVLKYQNGTPITKITIKESTGTPEYSNIFLVSEKFYEFGPDKALFDPYIIIDLPFDSSKVNENIPEIYRYYELSDPPWNPLESTSNGARISARSTNFSIYAVFIEINSNVKLSANIQAPASIEVIPDSINPEQPMPGTSSGIESLLIRNSGTGSLHIMADMRDETGELYTEKLYLEKDSYEILNVTGLVNQKEILVIWAEEVK
ncbi:MAG: hypothetical protein KAR85_03185 [Methanosarcinales archaeon]|nr:hypothetical protein [Methanosarcinales archaeon]